MTKNAMILLKENLERAENKMTREDLKNYLLKPNEDEYALDLLVEIGLELSGTDSFPSSLSYYENNETNFNKLIEELGNLSYYDAVKLAVENHYLITDEFLRITEFNDDIIFSSISYVDYLEMLYRSIDTVVNSLIKEAKKAPGYFKNVSTDLEFNDMLSEFISSEKKKEMKEKVKKALLEDDRLLQQTLREIDDSDFDKFTVYENEHDTIEHLHERYSEFKEDESNKSPYFIYADNKITYFDNLRDALNVATQHIDKIADYLVEHYDENFEYYDVVATLLAE